MCRHDLLPIRSHPFAPPPPLDIIKRLPCIDAVVGISHVFVAFARVVEYRHAVPADVGTALALQVITPFIAVDRRLALGARLDVETLHELSIDVILRLVARDVVVVWHVARCAEDLKAAHAALDGALVVCRHGSDLIELLAAGSGTAVIGGGVGLQVGAQRTLDELVDALVPQVGVELLKGDGLAALARVAEALDAVLAWGLCV